MTSMERLESYLAQAKSKKVTEYKKAIKSLLEFWENDPEVVIEKITDTSKASQCFSNSGYYSWNDIFYIVHDLFYSEIDRISKLSGNSGKLDKERVVKLVQITSQKANFCLKAKTVVSSVLGILQPHKTCVFSEYYEMYFSILKKYVLQERSQRIFIGSKQWSSLLEACEQILNEIIPNVDYVKVLEALELIIRYEKLWNNYEQYSMKSTDVLFKLTFTVCHQIATDSRHILCQFSECLPLSLIDLKGPEEKYRLYLLFVKIHHPNGATLDEEISFSYNPDKWKAVLNLLYRMILNDIKPSNLSTNFIELAAEVFHQRIFIKLPPELSQISNTFEESISIYIQPKKKRKLSDENNKLIDLVNERDPERAWPMIQIAITLYKKYPNCLPLEDYIEFLEIITKLMNKVCKNVAIMEDLCKLAIVFVQNENIYAPIDLKTHWDKLWDTILSYLSISHRETIKQGCILVQWLISREKVSNPNILLKLYLTSSIQWSNDSIETLKVFCEHNLIPNTIEGYDMSSSSITNDSIKIQLLQWTLNTLTKHLNNPLKIPDFSKVLIGFTLKSWYKLKKPSQNVVENHFISSENNPYDNIKDIEMKHIEECYLSLKLQGDLPINKQECLNAEANEDLDYSYGMNIMNYLVNSLSSSIQTEITDKDLSSVITKAVVLATFISDLKAMKMIPCSFDEFYLVNDFKEYLTRIMNHIININWSRNIRCTLEITKSLMTLYRSQYDESINQIILDLTEFLALKKIYDIAKISMDEFQSDEKIPQCKRNANIILASYCCIKTNNELSEDQMKIANTLLIFDKYDLSIKSHAVGVITLLDILMDIPQSVMNADFIKLLMEFINELFNYWCKDDKINRFLLSKLPILLEKFLKFGDENNSRKISEIIQLYHDYFAKGAFGQMSHLSLIQCFNCIVENRALASLVNDNVVLNQDIFTTFLKSPYYLVRYECIKYLQSLFSSKNISNLWKQDYFIKFKVAVYEIFLVDRELTDQAKSEERELRSVSAMQFLATVICSKSSFQSQALFMMLQIIVEKGINKKKVTKILELIELTNKSPKSIVVQNINYLIDSWCQETDKNFEDFPHYFFYCDNEYMFLERYIKFIFPALIRQQRIEDAKEIAKKLNHTFELIFKHCCVNIIPWALIDSSNVLERMQNNEDEFESIGKFDSLIKENLQNVMIQMVLRLHDLDHFYLTFETTVNLPASDPPHYEVAAINLGFRKLMKVVAGGAPQSVFLIVIKRKPSTIQKILLFLTRNIYFAHICEYRAKAVHQYVYFCIRIIDLLKEPCSDPVASYFIRDISCTLLNLAKEDDEVVANMCLTYLHTFLKSLMPSRSNEIGKILSTCVKILGPMIEEKNKQQKVTKVLDLLLKESRPLLTFAISSLGSIPKSFRDENSTERTFQSLYENLVHFLDSNDEKSCSIDNLQTLKQQLSSNHGDLEKLYEELEMTQGFAEDCESSVLHRLIYRLIRLTESTDIDLALEAAKCLGILGPADLGTMILHPQETQRRESDSKADLLTLKICESLSELVVSPDIDMRVASSDALHAILESAWGNRLADLTGKEANTLINIAEYLYPFKGSSKSNVTNLHVDVEEFDPLFTDKNELWSGQKEDSYSSWLAQITSSVACCLAAFYSKSLIPVFKLNAQFCELSLPRLICIIIDTEPNAAKRICHCINYFFHHHFNEGSLDPHSVSTLSKSRDAIRCMLEVVNHLRIQTNERVPLNFNYLNIALAAQFCSAYFSSVLYAELWCRSNLDNVRYFDSIPIIDQIYEQNAKRGKIVQDILKEAYTKIGDTDSIHGCGSSHLQDRRSRIPYYKNFQKLDKLVLSYDAELSVNRNMSASGMISALKESSLHFLAKSLITSMSSKDDTTDEYCYDTLWRLADWDQVTNLSSSSKSKKKEDFPAYHYEALKHLHENSIVPFKHFLKEAHCRIIEDLRTISLESCKAVYPKLCQLQMLREIEEFGTCDPEDYENLLAKWDKKKFVFNNHFQYVEPILSQRTTIFQIQNSRKVNPIIKTAFFNNLLDTARLARQRGHLSAAARALETLSQQVNLNDETENRLLYHEAKLAWMREDEDMARFNLRRLIKSDSVKPNLMARALRVYGNWIAENKSENPQAIIEKYYDKAIEVYRKMDDLSDTDMSDGCRAQAALAQFSHEQYIVITDYMMSPQFESLKECINYSRNVLSKDLKNHHDLDVRKAVSLSNRQISNDSIEVQNLHNDQAMYLTIAIRNYLSTLQNSEEHDFLIFRLVSLWLDNMYDNEVNGLLNKHLKRIPSYKFIPLIPQLAPHMSNVTDTFTNKIESILERCAMEHPHHTLPILLALKNLYNDSKYCGKKVTKAEPRVLGAQQLIQRLSSTVIGRVIEEMDRLSDALVKLAYYDIDIKGRAPSAKCIIPKAISICNIQNFEHAAVPTVTVDIKKNGKYSNVVCVASYDDFYGNVGGINAPKKIICLGTDGIKRPQLVKGKDDLRQDAVMQQVFTVMNSLLKSNKEAKQRRLYVRTYKVVPLTQRSGVLQWCENTLPLSSILVGEGGLHRKYYPSDWSPNDCRTRLRSGKTNPARQYDIFIECCEHLHPAFHHFFTESYLSPETWFERRLAYTRSVATTSIIGYILGLGDRHVSNILIDNSTAEVIHIDFGIAFEQGKVLPTPETVPFRLTRDIEAAMGVSGVEGTMRRCCEETMTVLREHREVIVTLLRVLLYDPLYSWAITPAKAATYQSEYSSRSIDGKESNSPGNVETNKLAERALLRVQQKLQGIEEGVASSIPGQVERLIQQARDPKNLSKLFEGWQAYL
uniref:Serine/threonine-protein kinase ATM n=1 Tax=Trichogramma kaykai TaxID=54128 RepID=A0ABD2WPC0_9HYME